MRTNLNSSALNMALILMAALSLFLMIALTQIDYLVHNVLYSFGLRFSYQWAMPYWVNSGLIIGLNWFNIIASFTLVYYVSRRKQRLQSPEEAKKTENVEEAQQSRLTGCVEFSVNETSCSGEAIETPVEELIQEQICDLSIQILEYDVRHPVDVVDSQC